MNSIDQHFSPFSWVDSCWRENGRVSPPWSVWREASCNGLKSKWSPSARHNIRMKLTRDVDFVWCQIWISNPKQHRYMLIKLNGKSWPDTWIQLYYFIDREWPFQLYYFGVVHHSVASSLLTLVPFVWSVHLFEWFSTAMMIADCKFRQNGGEKTLNWNTATDSAQHSFVRKS